jgi:hypothetical protein
LAKWLKLIIPALFIIAVVLYFTVFTGTVRINSTRPPGATVIIDGVVEGITPLKKRIRTGTRQITVSKKGFEKWQEDVKVVGMSPLTFSVKLRFLLRSDPTGAEVSIDGENIGVTEMAVELKPGTHLFEFRMDGYRDAKFKATIPESAGQPIPLVTLTPGEESSPEEERWPVGEPPSLAFGNVQVTSTPDAQVYLDGQWQGETPLTIKDVLVGSYVITFSREGYRDLRRTVYVNKDETSKIAGKLNPESEE